MSIITIIHDFVRAFALMFVFIFAGEYTEQPVAPAPERPVFEERELLPIVGPELHEEVIGDAPAVPLPEIVPCTTDLDCAEKNPHVIEQPDYELPTAMDVAFTELGYEPCVHEDGPGPCYWDATVRGNGTGDSFFMVSQDEVIYLSDGGS